MILSCRFVNSNVSPSLNKCDMLFIIYFPRGKCNKGFWREFFLKFLLDESMMYAIYFVLSLIVYHIRKAEKMKNIVWFSEGTKDQKELLGGKGANLAEMTSIGLPVPAGFIVTTDVCRQF